MAEESDVNNIPANEDARSENPQALHDHHHQSFFGVALVVRLLVLAARRRRNRKVRPDLDPDAVTVDPVAEPVQFHEQLPEADPYALRWGLRFNPKWVLKPWWRSYFFWLMIVSGAVMYNLLIIFPRAVFEQMENYNTYRITWIVLDYFCDALYLCDTVIKFLTGYLENGIIVREPRRLWVKYRSSRDFKLDLISILPTDFVFIYTGERVPWVILRVNRLFRLPRLAEFIYRAETRSDYPIFLRISVLIGSLLVITHINACLYYYVSCQLDLDQRDGWKYPGTARWNDTLSHYDDTLQQKYIFSFYWSAMLLTSILPNMNNPRTTAEIFFHCMEIFAGMLIFATIVARIGGEIANISRKRDIFRRKGEGVKAYMKVHREVGEDLETRVVKWFDYIWSTKQDLDEESVLTLLPTKLKAEIARFVHFEVLKQVRLFHDVEDQFLEELVLKLKFEPFSPGDYICRKGDIGRQMYVVRRGKLSVVSDDGTKVFATLAAGTVFGELSILNIPGSKNGNRRTANVRAVGYADLFSLSKEDLWDALKEYPQVRDNLLHKASTILHRDGLIDDSVAEQARRQERDWPAVTETIEKGLENLNLHMHKFLNDYFEAISNLNKELSELESRNHGMLHRSHKSHSSERGIGADYVQPAIFLRMT
ncbi:cyclic nucleotide-gated channel rod photoreceptor subunit alpha-like [Paramacrobiotus metropolitanus]|uniref:cyclic nucleotide-gated channel rod photoreceptor subunit alpha-like n=1 Tax=Paramacrobiotus metropolitanus TaxID=2943436 RepID=UPI002445B82F|nr:cyclic nucleotide-gated channel rod photoreceptor subunit alpha-like [Paramacrobiotus metropolitanus]